MRLANKSGRRLLSYIVNIALAQVDVFHIEAISLGSLKTVRVDVDDGPTEENWFLDKVIVKETDRPEDYVFLCNK